VADDHRSTQSIRGDTQGRIRIEFITPVQVTGDVMLITPGGFYSYHNRQKVVDTALWPTGWNEQDKQMFQLIRSGAVIARKVGEEQIAGRNAAIVQLSAARPNGVMGRAERKFWIDMETGIQLQIEKTNANGMPVSRTTMTNLSLYPSGLNPQLFAPIFPGARPEPLFPEQTQFHSLEEAQGQMAFHAVIPGALPPGFRQDGVWCFNGALKNPTLETVLLRYTDGVSTFSLYEHLAPKQQAEPPKPGMFRRMQQRWIINTPGGVMVIQYIGHLPPNQVRQVYASLR